MRQLTVPVGGQEYEITLTDRRAGEGGRHVWAARCRIPMRGAWPMQLSKRSAEVRDTKNVEAKSGGPLLTGIASSSSVDWHGTEMSSRALDGMARQFKDGVAYVPSHREDEWDEVFGRTIDAQIERGDIASRGDIKGPGEGQVLRVTVELFMDDPRAQRLVRMVERGQVVGWSIGGWFTEMEVVTNDDDEVERMIINDVELDHLATTRRPSNPDSWIRELQRSVSDAYMKTRAEEDEEEEDLDDAEEEDAKADESEGEESEAGESEGAEEEAATDESEGEDEFLDDADDSENLDDDDDERGCLFCGSKKDDDRALDEDDVEEDEDEAQEIEDAEEPKEETEEAEEEEEEEDEENIFDDLPPTAEEEEEEDDRESRALSGSTGLPLAEDDLPWSWSTEAANKVLDGDDWERFRKAHFWYDETKPEVRSSYKLPFAKMIDGHSGENELHAVWAGIKAAMAALNGARGGVDISDDDKMKIHNRIHSYYMRFDKGEPPPLARSGGDCITKTGAPLDTNDSAGEYRQQVAKAHRSRRPPEQTFTPEQEAAVSDTRDQNTAPSAGPADMAATLASMNELLTQLVRDRPEATPETPVKVQRSESPETLAMQARIADLEGLVTKMAGMSQRQGRQHVGLTSAKTTRGVSALVRDASAELGDGSALVLVAKDQADRRSSDKTALPSRVELEADLRAVLQAALADGVITDPEARSNWR